MSVFYMLMFGTTTAIGLSLTGGIPIDTSCVLIYLAMILGALMSIAETLEKKS